MGIYVDDDLKYVVNAKSLNTKLSLEPGEPQNCGAAMGPLRRFEFHCRSPHRHHLHGSVCNFAGKQQHRGVAGAFYRHGIDFDLRQGCGLHGHLQRAFAR